MLNTIKKFFSQRSAKRQAIKLYIDQLVIKRRLTGDIFQADILIGLQGSLV